MKEKFAVSIVFKIVSQIFLTIANYFLFLNLNVDLMGLFFLLISIVDFFFAFFDLGTTVIHFQYSTRSNFDEFFSSFLIIRMILLAGSIIYSILLSSVFNLWSQEYSSLMIALIFAKIFTLSSYIFLENLRAKKKFLRYEIPVFLIGCLKSSLYIIFSYTLLDGLNDLMNLILINFFSSLLLFIISSLIFPPS